MDVRLAGSGTVGTVARILRQPAGAAGRWLGRLVADPEYRSLRILLLVGFLIRAALVPLTDWGLDTPALAQGASALGRLHDPYAAGATIAPVLDPPLGMLIASPLFALVRLLFPATQVLLPVHGHLAGVVAWGEAPPWLPTTASLVALKLPSILADLAVAGVLFEGGRAMRPVRSTLLAAAWLLNPLVIWTSAVVGHFDAVAALFVLLALAALSQGRLFVAGVSLGLGTAVKLYPAFLVPVAMAVVLSSRGPGSSSSSRQAGIVRLLGGFGLSLLVLVPFLPALYDLYVRSATFSQQPFGGLSMLALFNPGFQVAYGYPFPSPGRLPALLLFLPLLSLLVAAPVLLARISLRLNRSLPAPIVPSACLALIVGSLVSYRSPQPENLVGVLPLLLLASPVLGRWSLVAFAGLSAAAWGLDLAQLTPLGYFYPLWAGLGPTTVHSVDGIVLPYLEATGLESRFTLFLLFGILGAGILWATLVGTLRVLAREGGRPSGAGQGGFTGRSAAAQGVSSVRVEQLPAAPRRLAGPDSPRSMALRR